MTTFTVSLRNDTDVTWVFTLFQTLPNQPQLASVAWLLQGVSGPNGTSSISWNDAFAAVIATYDSATRVFSQTQFLPAQPGDGFQVVTQSGVQQLQAGGDAPTPGTLLIRNRSGSAANPGLGMSNVGALYAPGVLSGANASFDTDPSYWIALFNRITQGELILQGQAAVALDERFSVFVGPEPVVFPTGVTTATATAAVSGQSITLTVTPGTT